MPKIVIFLGAPGSGKGTQAQYLSRELAASQLSTGDMLRTAIKEKTDLGKIAKDIIEKGDLVPDHLILDLMSDAIQQNKAELIILDGFPRTTIQAEGLDKVLKDAGLKLNQVILFDIEPEETVRRISGRRLCSHCNKVSHITELDSEAPCAANQQHDWISRADDTEEKVWHRYKVYQEQTAPLISYYKEKITSIDASQHPEAINQALSEII